MSRSLAMSLACAARRAAAVTFDGAMVLVLALVLMAIVGVDVTF